MLRHIAFCWLAMAWLAAPLASALEPQQIALIVNRNAPEGRKLAEFYAQQRQIPPGRIIELDLPLTEQISFERYERDVVPPIRQFLRERKLDRQVTCLVTFYGVPLRIADRAGSPREARQTGAALDSELSLLWRDFYPRAGWQANGLHLGARGGGVSVPLLMVMRLDAPHPGLVRQIIVASIQAEKRGLRGRLALDSRGLRGSEPLAQFDQRIRDLGDLIITTKARVPVVLDDEPGVFPAASLVDNVAMYCGWYSVRSYVPAFTFNPGAVGYHIASFEMLSLHGADEQGWCAGLLRDGVVATLGPVAEPYLQSFPMPDEFFPLLMTGKLTLAEVYWKTTPMSSWMLCAIGDPLYRPFATTPAMQISDLPLPLRSALLDAATQPAQ